VLTRFILPVAAFMVSKLSVAAPAVSPVIFKALLPVAKVKAFALLVMVVAPVRLPPSATFLPVRVRPLLAVVLSFLFKVD